MDCASDQTTIENRLGRAGGLAALCDSRLCQPEPPILRLPILTRSAALLTLLLQDGTVDLELTSSVVALDPGLAFGTLQAANLERDGNGEIWQLPLALVAAGCDRLQAMVNSALKIESSYDCATSARLRQLYLRGVQRACVAELLTIRLGNANPKRSYVGGLLFGLPSSLTQAGPKNPGLGDDPTFSSPGGFPACTLTDAGDFSNAYGDPVAAIVLLADGLLEISGGGNLDSSSQPQRLAASPLWGHWEALNTGDRCQLLAQAVKWGTWAAANAPRLSPWEFMVRLRRKSWE